MVHLLLGVLVGLEVLWAKVGGLLLEQKALDGELLSEVVEEFRRNLRLEEEERKSDVEIESSRQTESGESFKQEYRNKGVTIFLCKNENFNPL